MPQPLQIISILLLGILISCSEKDESLIDVAGLPPFVSGATISPDTVDSEEAPAEPSGQVTITVIATANVDDPDGLADIARVDYSVTRPGDPRFSFTGELQDDGISPDSSLSDGIYAGNVSITIDPNDIGNYAVEFFATDHTGFTSNVIRLGFTVIRTQNQPPSISNLQAPDTVQLPQIGSILFLMTVDATDPEGLSDIAEVFFRSLDSSDPTFKFQLKDDGNAQVSGDVLAGDGTYSILVQLSSTNVPGTFRFEFQAVDKSGAVSNTILHTLTIIP